MAAELGGELRRWERMREDVKFYLLENVRSYLRIPACAAGGRASWFIAPRPRCSALLVADKAEQKCVPGSVADAADLSARKIPGTPNGRKATQPHRRQGAHRAPQAGPSQIPRSGISPYKQHMNANWSEIA